MSARAARLAGTAALTLIAAYAAVSLYVANEVTRVDRAPIDRSAIEVAPAVEDVAFQTADGFLLRGWFVAGSRDRAAVVVHGKDGNRIDSEHLVRVARWLREVGYALLLFDLRGHGESEGERFSLGQHERLDVAAAVDLLAARGYPRGRIALVGESMGAGTVIQSLLLRPDVGAIVADSSYSDGAAIVAELGATETGLPDWFTPGVVLASRLFGLDPAAVDPAAVVRANPGRAFLLIHCARDDVVAVEHARHLAAASASRRTELWLAPDCGHVGASSRYPDEYRQRLLAFLDAQMR